MIPIVLVTLLVRSVLPFGSHLGPFGSLLAHFLLLVRSLALLFAPFGAKFGQKPCFRTVTDKKLLILHEFHRFTKFILLAGY